MAFFDILYGAFVRFYSTVVEWDYLNMMKDDVIERLTSKIFDEPAFGQLLLGFFIELKKGDDEKLRSKLDAVQTQILPVHFDLPPQFRLDAHIETVWKAN